MPNVIAVIWDFDKTLIDGYMQTPIFKGMESMKLSFGRKSIVCRMNIKNRGYR